MGIAEVKSGLSLREKPQIAGKKLATIPAGKEFIILDSAGPEAVIEQKPGRWFKVKYLKKTGWVFGGFVTVKPPATKAPEPEAVASTAVADPATLQAQEAAAIASFSNLVHRDKETLHLKLKTGDEKLLVDSPEPAEEMFTKYRFLRYLPEQEVFLVSVSLYEGHQYLLISQETGMDTGTDGEPVFSPEGKRFFSASCDLVAGYQDNGIDVFAIDRGFMQKIFLMRATQWGPVDAAWESQQVIRLVKLGTDGKRVKARLTYDPAKDHWTFAETK